MDKLLIKVPGSTANLGAGFDSIGLAVDRYLTIEVEPSVRWEFIYRTPGFESIPTDEDNLIYKAFQFTATELAVSEGELPAYKLFVDCELPLASGLGSSAAAIVAGIELANVSLNLSLSNEKKARLASLYEGHPDNVCASIYGGLIVATHNKEDTIVIPSGVPSLDMVIMIPPHKLITSDSRDVLPNSLSYEDSIQASSIANVLIAALLSGNLEVAGKMMKADLFHQPYRSEIIPDLQVITTYGNRHGIEGVALSGAGPSIICFTKKGKGNEVMSQLASAFPNYRCEKLTPSSRGSTVTSDKRTYS